MKTITLLLCGIILTICSCSDSSGDKSSIANVFYTTVKTHSMFGVPNDTDLVKLAPYISTRLSQQLQGAYKKEVRLQGEAKEPEPPQFENCIFTSAFEGFSTIKDIKADSSCNDCILITFVLDAPDTLLKPVIWTDRVHFLKEHGRWVIDDIEYLFNCQFCPSGHLRLTLEAFIKE